MAQYLQDNCYLPERAKKYGNSSTGMRFQVPWGKHSPVSWRGKHKAIIGGDALESEFLPVVVIKDPFTWMTSMCRHSYAANWFHTEEHCPNLVPITPEEKAHFGENALSVTVNISYSSENITHHQSMVDLWNKYYGDWIDAEFPRIIVRFEDLIYNAEKVVGEVCTCAGGLMRGDEFKYTTDSAKKGKVHSGSSGFLTALSKYSNATLRLESFQLPDLEYSRRTLRPDIMETFQYSMPPLR